MNLSFKPVLLMLLMLPGMMSATPLQSELIVECAGFFKAFSRPLIKQHPYLSQEADEVGLELLGKAAYVYSQEFPDLVQKNKFDDQVNARFKKYTAQWKQAITEKGEENMDAITREILYCKTVSPRFRELIDRL